MHESMDDFIARVQGQKAFWDEQKRRGTYNRMRRAEVEKRVSREGGG